MFANSTQIKKILKGLDNDNISIDGIPRTQEAINEQIEFAKSLEEKIGSLSAKLKDIQSGTVLEIPVDFQLPANYAQLSVSP